MKPRHSENKRRSHEKKIVPLNLRVAQAEKEAFTRAAEISGIGLSSWIRERLRTAAFLELDNVGETAAFMRTTDQK